ncbi:MAG: outer membrane beta-barrel protein [Candidatus Kryptoniota bacterium]
MSNLRKMIFLALIPCTAFAQRSGDWTVSGTVYYAQPLGSLNSFFVGAPAFALKVGQFTDQNLLWEIKLESISFTNTNKNSLNQLVRDIPLELKIYGAAAEMTYFLNTAGRLKPYVIGSAGMYRWFYNRGSHYAIGIGNSLDSTHFLPSFKLSDWSAGFSLGSGADYEIATRLSVYADLRYQLIVGEIWQTLSLGMDNVSTMQMGTVSIGIRYKF